MVRAQIAETLAVRQGAARFAVSLVVGTNQLNREYDIQQSRACR
ncbi:hypothetical protein AWB67_02671 [Caballeronia terrestris]|uniref:Uncharacterized protein n=1 Tax=Caballeronia terrestris TaxID=1226301 RepID=A0A158IMF0_9BURK|nr:hypothetical protein AWB67_02671 [Caballeronia terrestris]